MVILNRSWHLYVSVYKERGTCKWGYNWSSKLLFIWGNHCRSIKKSKNSNLKNIDDFFKLKNLTHSPKQIKCKPVLDCIFSCRCSPSFHCHVEPAACYECRKLPRKLKHTITVSLSTKCPPYKFQRKCRIYCNLPLPPDPFLNVCQGTNVT